MLIRTRAGLRTREPNHHQGDFMNNCRRHIRFLLLSAAVVAAPLSAAQAQDVNAALERFKALWEEQGMAIEWENAAISGDDAVLENVTVTSAGEDFEVSNIAFEDISDDPEGYRVRSITMDDFEVEGEDGFYAAVSGIGMNNVLMPNDDVRDNYGGFIFYEKAHVDDARISVDGVDVASMTNAQITITPPVSGAPISYTGSVEKFFVDLSLAKDSEQWPIIEALGYQQISGSIKSSGKWNPQDGDFELTETNITINDAGTLGMSFTLGGYTRELIASLREIQQQMADDPEADSTAQGMAALGLMQQMSFRSAEISFTDDSLTSKVLELVAQMQGMSKTDVAAIAKGAVPFAVSQLGDSDFTASTTQAVSAFLDNPKVIRITAKPANDVPFALIMAEGMSTPQGLIKTLNVKVTAND